MNNIVAFPRVFQCRHRAAERALLRRLVQAPVCQQRELWALYLAARAKRAAAQSYRASA